MNSKKEILEWIRSIALAILLAFAIRFLLFGVYVVEGSSMYPTMEEYERLVVNKLIYRFDEPSYGDIIVFKYNSRQDFVKRVIAIEGDTIQISEGQVFRNGELLEEPYLHQDLRGQVDFGPVVVPTGSIFVLGDHRLHSKDSRDPQVGFISLTKIRGKVSFVFWPPGEARIPN